MRTNTISFAEKIAIKDFEYQIKTEKSIVSKVKHFVNSIALFFVSEKTIKRVDEKYRALQNVTLGPAKENLSPATMFKIIKSGATLSEIKHYEIFMNPVSQKEFEANKEFFHIENEAFYAMDLGQQFIAENKAYRENEKFFDGFQYYTNVAKEKELMDIAQIHRVKERIAVEEAKIAEEKAADEEFLSHLFDQAPAAEPAPAPAPAAEPAPAPDPATATAAEPAPTPAAEPKAGAEEAKPKGLFSAIGNFFFGS